MVSLLACQSHFIHWFGATTLIDFTIQKNILMLAQSGLQIVMLNLEESEIL